MFPRSKLHSGIALLALLAAVLGSNAVSAQTFNENFTGKTTTNSWFFFGGACLTAGNQTGLTQPGAVPGCATVQSTYYNSASDRDPNQVGGDNGYLGATSSPTSPDTVGLGALRFTNGYPYGHNEKGAIVSGFTFPTSQGLEITFKTVTYLGDSGGGGRDGADGMSFFLMDGCTPIIGATAPAGCPSNAIYGSAGQTFPAIGAFGGSLAYTCSNANSPYDGLVGAYLGLGIDEYGNFLNGVNNTLSETGSSNTGGDNTATGGLYQPGRIGMRGAGSVSWLALNTAYGVNPNTTTLPYYPLSLTQSCSTGVYDSAFGLCESCSSGSYNNGQGTCTVTTPVCPAGYNMNLGITDTTMQCVACPSADPNYISDITQSGYPYGYCLRTPTSTTKHAPTGETASTLTPASNTAAPSNSPALAAVQKTCKSGHLWNYSNPASPVDVGAATLANTANTAGVLDYAAIPGAYSVLSNIQPGLQIAKESATTRGAATPIYYDLKITQDGFLTLSYSLSGAAYQTVIKNQPITASNGPLPSSFRFGFAGSSGGSTNVHEIMCFKAVPSQQSGGSTSVNERQSAKIQSTTQAYFGFYNPTPTVWTGDLTANYLIDTNGTVTVASNANWSAQCNLTGVGATGTCPRTGVAGPLVRQAPSSRVIMSWDGTKGVPFEWSNLSAAQQTALNDGDSNGQTRVDYLRGERANEVPAGLNLYRAREGVLADIVDSSPTWVGPPISPYTAAWVDRLYSTATAPESGSTAQTYLQFAAVNSASNPTGKGDRLNVVYVGSNDGLLHGFRTGSFDSNGNFVANSSTPNDGAEVLAYMPGSTIQSTSNACAYSTANPGQSVAQSIHGVIPANTTCSPSIPADTVNGSIDFSGTQYGHNFFVDATPGTGDLFYNGSWHTWLVGGMGPGGAVIYALDITNPSSTNFTEANAANVVVGEWNSATISCSGNAACGKSMGNTYGTPLIRRLHNGMWAVIFGNGLNSASGDAGVYVMTVDPTTAATTFYYLSTATGSSASPNGISYVASADLDGDHITDYLYAGDLQGNLWRFDLTSSNPTLWVAGSAPLFKTQSGQPITSEPVVSAIPVTGGSPRVLIGFGTGQRQQLTNTTSTSYASGTQDLYGVWDWNMAGWNAIAHAQYASLSSGPGVLGKSNLTQQTFTYNSTSLAWDGTNNTICWQNTSICTSGGNNSYGWYADLPGTSEQVIYNPALYNGAFIVDSTVPANNIPSSCSTNLDTGNTYAINVASGGALTNVFPQYHDVTAAGIQTSATGTPYVVNTVEGTTALVYQTVGGIPGSMPFNPPVNTKANRLTWIQLR